MQGTAAKEAEAAEEMSALVNYIQPVHFTTFEQAQSKWFIFSWMTNFLEYSSNKNGSDYDK